MGSENRSWIRPEPLVDLPNYVDPNCESILAKALGIPITAIREHVRQNGFEYLGESTDEGRRIEAVIQELNPSIQEAVRTYVEAVGLPGWSGNF